MVIKKLESGYVIRYDDTIKKGDLITTYQSGIYEFDHAIDRGPNNAPLYCYYLRYDTNGVKKNGRKKLLQCDAGYCSHAGEFIRKEIEKSHQKIENLKNILESHNL